MQRQARRDNRYARYEAARTLYQQGFSVREIARRLERSRVAITRYVQADTFPERAPHPRRSSILDPHKPYVLQQWKEGCWNGMQLCGEIQAQGFTGSQPTLRDFLAELRKQHYLLGQFMTPPLDLAPVIVMLPSSLPPKRKVTRRMSPARASWLLFLPEERLTDHHNGTSGSACAGAILMWKRPTN